MFSKMWKGNNLCNFTFFWAACLSCVGSILCVFIIARKPNNTWQVKKVMWHCSKKRLIVAIKTSCGIFLGVIDSYRWHNRVWHRCWICNPMVNQTQSIDCFFSDRAAESFARLVFWLRGAACCLLVLIWGAKLAVGGASAVARQLLTVLQATS